MFAQEKEEALSREREVSQQRAREQLERHEQQLQQLRARFVAELDAERGRFAAEGRRATEAHEDALARQRREAEERVVQLQKQHAQVSQRDSVSQLQWQCGFLQLQV